MRYIMHEEYNKKTFYGPFEDYEVDERIQDPFSLDLLLTGRLLSVQLSPEEIEIFDPLPASIWYDQLEDIFEAEHTFDYDGHIEEDYPSVS